MNGVLKGHKRGIWSVAFSPVDKCVATASADNTIKIFSVTDFSCLKTFEGSVFSRDFVCVPIVFFPAQLFIYLFPVLLVGHTASVLKAAFITNGMQLVSVGGDGLMKVWTIKTGALPLKKLVEKPMRGRGLSQPLWNERRG